MRAKGYLVYLDETPRGMAKWQYLTNWDDNKMIHNMYNIIYIGI